MIFDFSYLKLRNRVDKGSGITDWQDVCRETGQENVSGTSLGTLHL